MGDSQRADELVRQAEKKLSSFSFFGLNKSAQYDAASSLLEKAANQYKLSKQWQQAGTTFEKLGNLHLKNESGSDAATAFTDAAKCYQKTNKSDVVRVLHRAIEYYTENGRLGQAARQLREIAETTEKQGSKDECLIFYRQAADLYAGEEQTSEANKCRTKIATLGAELESYAEASEIFESMARSYVDNNLLKYSAKGLLLNAGLCQLCLADEVAMRSALERYDDIDLNFANSREANFLKDLADACEEGDVDKFTNTVAEFDNMTRLDGWKTTLLLRVKKRIPEEDFT